MFGKFHLVTNQLDWVVLSLMTYPTGTKSLKLRRLETVSQVRRLAALP